MVVRLIRPAGCHGVLSLQAMGLRAKVSSITSVSDNSVPLGLSGRGVGVVIDSYWVGLEKRTIELN